MADVPIINVGVEGLNKIDELNSKIDQTGKKTEKSVSEIVKLRKELRDAKSDMLQFADGTEQYNKALTKAASIQGRLKESNDIIRASVRDLGEVTKKVGGAVSGLASGFQVAQGVISLFGVESENTLKVIQNITAAMSITQGIVQFANGFDDLQDILTGFRANAAMSKDAVSELSDVSKDAAGNLGNVAKESAVIGSNLAGGAVAANGMNKSISDLNKTLLSRTEIEANATKGTEEAIKVNKGNIRETLIQKGLQKELNEVQGKSVEVKENLNKSTEDLSKSTEKFGANLGKQLLTMGLWIAAIAAVTYGITKLIEWMNEIPEDLKIELGIYDSIKNDVVKSRVLINNFVHDWNKASKEMNDEKLKQLIEYAKKEKLVNETQLKNLKTDAEKKKEINDLYFKDYLKTAENTYFNESIIKQKAEAKSTGSLALVKAQESYKEYKKSGSKGTYKNLNWNDFVNRAARGDLDEKAFEVLGVFQVAQSVIDNLRIVNEQNKIIKSLSKIKLKTPDQYIINTDTTKQTKIPTSKKSLSLDTKQLSRPDLTEGESFIKPILDSEIKYTNEERVILEDNLKMRSKYYYDSVLSQMEFALKLENARRDDLQNELDYQNEQKDILIESVKDFDDKKAAYDIEISNLNDYEKNKSKYLNLITDAENEFKNLGDKATESDKKRIEEKIKLYNDEIKIIDDNIDSKKKEIATLTVQLKQYEGYPDKMKEITDKIAQLNVDISESTRNAAQIERDAWAERLQNVKGYVDTVGKLSDTFVNMTNDQMEIIDNRTNKEKNDLELSQKYREADSEQQQEMMYQLEIANYNQKKKIFETNKAFQISSAIITGISGELDAISNFLKNGGFTNPLAIASLAAETIAITTGTIMTVKKIASTSLDKPIPPSGGGGAGGAGGVNVALNPSSTALTSNDERLNTMNKSNLKDQPTSVVRVTDINETQRVVRVREQNSSF